MDALRLGDLGAFRRIEADSGDWWHPLLDRGAGAALHFAADHGQARVQANHCFLSCALSRHASAAVGGAQAVLLRSSVPWPVTDTFFSK